MGSVSPVRASASSTDVSPPQEHLRVRLWVGWSSVLFAFLQSVCTFLMAMAGLRLIVGVSSLLLSAEGTTLLDRLHADWLRMLMISLAFIGATLNLIAILQIWRLRARPASHWRQAPVAASTLHLERWQLALSLITFALIVLEEGFHLRLSHHL